MNYVEIADYNWAEGSLMLRAGKCLKKETQHLHWLLRGIRDYSEQQESLIILWQKHNEINLCHHR